jgi:AraC-like DNA-binding protein
MLMTDVTGPRNRIRGPSEHRRPRRAALCSGSELLTSLYPPRPAAHDFAPVQFSTRDLPERERLPRWREELGRHFVRMDIEPLAAHLPFHAEAVLQALPGVRTVSCASSAARLTRTRAMAAESDGSIGLVVNLGPKATVSQKGKEVTLEAGDAFPMLTDEVAEVTSTHLFGLLLPWNSLAARVSDLEAVVMRVIPRRVEALRLLVSYLGAVQKDGPPVTPELRQSVVRHIHELAALAIGANRDIEAVGLKAAAAARLAVALADIAESFTDPELTVKAVARRQGVTPRYLQQLLQALGTSFTAHVNELRLQRAFALLTDAHAARRRICDIAMDAGFSDVTHFNRLFRARFGESPSGIRAQQ